MFIIILFSSFVWALQEYIRLIIYVLQQQILQDQKASEKMLMTASIHSNKKEQHANWT